jgi:hypothetical protein
MEIFRYGLFLPILLILFQSLKFTALKEIPGPAAYTSGPMTKTEPAMQEIKQRRIVPV